MKIYEEDFQTFQTFHFFHHLVPPFFPAPGQGNVLAAAVFEKPNFCQVAGLP